jgi:hypothetical protein
MIVRRVGVWSVAKLYGALSAAMGLLFGAVFALVALIGGMANLGGDAGFQSGALGALFGVGAVVLMPVFYGVLGIIMGAISAALYNLFAGIFGGVEIDVS